MTIFIVSLIFLEAVLAAIVFMLPQIEAYWLIALAISPLLLLSFSKKPTLKSAQRVYAIVNAVAIGTVAVYFANSLAFCREFYGFNNTTFFAIFLAVFTVATATSSVIISTTKQHYRVFAIGVLFAIAYCCIPQNSVVLCAICYCLLVATASCFFASATILNRQLTTASEILQVKNVAPKLAVRNLAFVATAINLIFIATSFLEHNAHIAGICLNIVCAVSDVAMLFTYLRQPLDFVVDSKIQLIRENRSDVDLQKVREQISQKLCNCQNYPLAMALRKFLSMFFHLEVEGLQKVTESSACFVANHYEIYGPFITVLKFPRTFRPWTDSLITNKSTLTRQLRSGVEIATKKFLIKPIRKKLPALVANTLWKTVHCFRAIPVYRRNSEKINEMWEESVNTLLTGDDVLIFPEKPDVGTNYKIGDVDKFQTGFVELALHYKQQTNRDLAFYPLYIDKKGKRMVIGDKVTLDSQAVVHEEKQRVAQQLYQQMKDIYNNCK